MTTTTDCLLTSPAPAPIDPTKKDAEMQRPGRFHRPELDALRLLAFLLVWLSHSLPGHEELARHRVSPTLAWWALALKDAGNFGVPIFFFLSAYLITELLRRESELTGNIALRAFYIRRVLRIWPLYLGVLAIYALLGVHFHGFRIETGRLLASLLLAGNWYLAFHPAILTPMRALWSISVEEQFYLGWPLLFRSLRPESREQGAATVLLLSILATVALAAVQPASWLHVTLWVNSLVQFQYFALGALAALLLNGKILRLRMTWRVLGAGTAAALALIAAGVLQIKRAPHPAYALSPALAMPIGYFLVGVACVLIFVAVLGLSRAPGWAVALGRVSFGLYVFHETGFFLADTLFRHTPALASFADRHWVLALAANKTLSLAITVPLAFASYHYWEKAFLRLKDRFTIVASRAA